MANEPSNQADQPVAPQTQWNPPGAEMDFDQVFGGAYEPVVQQEQEPAPGAPDQQPQQVTQTQPVQEPAAPAAPKEPPAPQWYLETDTGSRYKSREDAARGFAEKDRSIEKMRQLFIALHGVDPLTEKQATPQGPVSYLRNPNRYAQDLTEAASKGQFDKYTAAQLQLFDEYLQQRLGPYMPVVQKVGQRDALDSVSKRNPEFSKFYGTEAYNKTLENHPMLKNAIEQAENTPQLAETLPELYGYAWEFSAASRLSEQPGGAPPAQNQPAQPRSLTEPQTLTPPGPGAKVAPPTLATSAGRKELMKQLEAKGVQDTVF